MAVPPGIIIQYCSCCWSKENNFVNREKEVRDSDCIGANERNQNYSKIYQASPTRTNGVGVQHCR